MFKHAVNNNIHIYKNILIRTLTLVVRMTVNSFEIIMICKYVAISKICLYRVDETVTCFDPSILSIVAKGIKILKTQGFKDLRI